MGQSSTQAELEGVQRFLETTYIRGQIPAPIYYQNLITLASDWVCTHHDVERALMLLNRCPPQYFLSVCYNQALENVFFREAVVDLANTLVQVGCGPEPTPEPSVPEAQA